ncbi:G-type lectin S-receptor-like serine/threonine-protein kinase LECRK2 [Tasmannia lanceolata]|uniref:G-type lectin S-receptor-like serine/threonine-protein kinase LECRK2 n=1 Tax=Tasmannia lanceolata TaxID=3420 RepID=UPI0040642ECF
MASALDNPLFFLLALLLFPVSAVAQSNGSISLGFSLSTSDNTSWVSPSGDFAFGFTRVADKDLFLLAIWFDKVPEKTIIWSANGDNLVLDGSKVELTSSGNLVHRNHQGRDMEGSKFRSSTDTILPTQILDQGSMLSSRETKTNYSSGKFELRFQTDGNLVLYTTNLLTNYLYNAYWSSDTAGTDSQMIFNQSGYIYLRQTNGSIHNLTLGNIVSTRDFYHRATLDFDGVFRQYIYPKNGLSNRNWADCFNGVDSQMGHQPEQATPEQNFSGMHLRLFTYKELEEVTDGFKQELGSGAFGTVYKGVLTSSTGNFVAVKKLEKLVEEGDKEFKAEITAKSIIKI